MMPENGLSIMARERYRNLVLVGLLYNVSVGGLHALLSTGREANRSWFPVTGTSTMVHMKVVWSPQEQSEIPKSEAF